MTLRERYGDTRTAGFRVGGPHQLRPIVTRAIALLRAGTADDIALADAASAAMGGR